MITLIAIVLVAILAGGAYALFRRISQDSARIREVRAIVAQESEQTLALPADEAYARANELLTEYASTETWGPSIPPHIEGQLATLDPGLADLLRRFRRIHFPDPEGLGTDISAELVSSAPPTTMPDGHVMIGTSPPNPWALTTRPGDPRVYEVINGRVREEYPSIAHFILLTQDPDE